MSANIAENINIIKAKIVQIRPKAELIAVSKNHDVNAVLEALDSGQNIFGENRVQEAAQKFTGLRAKYPNLELHLIGPLQTNKVKEALQVFDVIQTLDREKLALAIAREQATGNRLQATDFMIQVNIGEEPQKAGINPKQTGEFYKFCKNLGLNITGLMCIPPADEAPALFFGLLQNIARNLSPDIRPLKLSMGMSGDYEQALKFKADYIRVGSSIFGERQKL